ncbi:MAG: hypothetical protein QOE54_6546 [Streptosporangiaceae bacterium]|jgi:hypothetical protein|nr:hypothetical protein [Streptosporangiaceae bacterium]MDX6434180.1 hypothetical protein [Streptosporangiaceae bacterium]
MGSFGRPLWPSSGNPEVGAREPAVHTRAARDRRSVRFPEIRQRKREMSDLVFVLLTVAVFVLFGLIVKAVERL